MKFLPMKQYRKVLVWYAATTKIFPQTGPKFTAHKKLTPRKIPAIRYVSLRLASLGGGPVHCMYMYMYIGSLSLHLTCATLYCTKSCRDAGVVLGFSLRGG